MTLVGSGRAAISGSLTVSSGPSDLPVPEPPLPCPGLHVLSHIFHGGVRSHVSPQVCPRLARARGRVGGGR